MIGIGGSGMQALADVLLTRGWQLSGSDVAAGSAAWLLARQVPVYTGHEARHLDPETELVIASDAVAPDNVERRTAERLGIAHCTYPQALAALMAEQRGIAVAGTHGKSTTAAMIVEIMTEANLDPAAIVGAAPRNRATGGRAGNGPWFVAEACEYRRHFLELRPEIAAVLSIEHDHFDCFATLDQAAEAYRQFVSQIRPRGTLIASADCPVTREVSSRCGPGNVVTFGLAATADWQPRDMHHDKGRYSFDLAYRRASMGRVALHVAGRHQVQNALAAAAVCHGAGVEPADIVRGLCQFGGLRRRLEPIAATGGIDLLDDYAHHPTEVRAALSAIRQMHPGRRLWCVFQPHQISRTLALAEEFAESLLGADRIAVAAVYPARETVVVDPLAVSADVARRVRARGGMVLPDCRAQSIFNHIAEALQPGDVVVTLGAGDIRKHCDELADRIRTDCTAR